MAIVSNFIFLKIFVSVKKSTLYICGSNSIFLKVRIKFIFAIKHAILSISQPYMSSGFLINFEACSKKLPVPQHGSKNLPCEGIFISFSISCGV